MDLLQQILDNSQYSFLTAFILGLMTAISPCPLATNITAIGFISRDLQNRKAVFLSGLIYTLGRIVGYAGLALLIFSGFSKMKLSLFFQGWGEKALGPVLIIIGLFMLGVLKVNFSFFDKFTEKVGDSTKKGYVSAFLLGIMFSLAFCPYSGVLYFAILIPMTISSANGLYLPVLFAIATSLPVIIFAWLLAYATGKVGSLYNKMQVFEKGFRKGIAFLFILIGIYYIVIFAQSII